MKPHLPRVLFLSLLAALSTVNAATYMADGVVYGNETASTRFYDTGKGYYWTRTYANPYKGAQTLYNQYGNFSFLGSLSSRINGNTFGTDAFAYLTRDAETCWYQASANALQYWESYYGVFYKGNRTLPYGYTYSTDHLAALGGTQSLNIGMLFYDNAKNEGGNMMRALEWYMCGTNADSYFTNSTSYGGFFTDYFKSNPWGYYTFVDTPQYSYELPKNGTPALLQAVRSGFGQVKQADGTYAQQTLGQILELGVYTHTGGAHSIACYGYETDSRDNLKALYITNSDDYIYGLTKLYVKSNAQNEIELYWDEACTQLWDYATKKNWYISHITYVNTPQTLKDMYAVYTAKTTPLVWTGKSNAKWAKAPKNVLEKLPTAATGWDVPVMGDSYHSYFAENRPVVFDDSAANTTVAISGSVSVSDLRLNNNTKEYVFNGSNNAKITANSITPGGSRDATFNQTTVNCGAADYSGYSIFFDNNSVFQANTCTLNQNAILCIWRSKAAISRLTLNSGSAMSLYNADLKADKLVGDRLVLWGNNTVTASKVNATGYWDFNLYESAKEKPVLTICSATGSDINLIDLNVIYDPAERTNGTYKLLEFSAPTGTQPTSYHMQKNGEGFIFGTLTYDDTPQENGLTLYTLSLKVIDSLIVPQRSAATLTWTSSGGWWMHNGSFNKWSGNGENDPYFLNGDSVIFDKGANVTIYGKVQPKAITVRNSSGTVTFDEYNTSAGISGSGKLTKSGAGALVLNTANSYTGGTALKGGTLTMGQVSSLGTGGIAVSAGTLGMGKLAVANAITATGGKLSGTAYKGKLKINGNVSLSNNFRAASLTLMQGALTANLSTAAVKSLVINGGSITGSLTLNGGSITLAHEPLRINGALNITAATALNLDAYRTLGTFTLLEANSISGNVSLLNYTTLIGRCPFTVSTGGNKLTLCISNPNATLTWNSTAGTWEHHVGSADGCWDGGGAHNISYMDGDAVVFNKAATVPLKGEVKPQSITVSNTAGTVTIKAADKNSRLAGKAKLTKSGAGTLTLNNGNTYTGGTVINAGTVKAGGATAFGTGGIALKGGTLKLGSHAVANIIKVSGSSNLTGSAYAGALTIAANMGAGTNISISKTATLAKGKVNGVLTGAAGVKVTGEATLAGANTYKGTTAVMAGGLLHLTGTVAGNYSVAGTLDASQKAITLGSGKTMAVADGGIVTGKVTVNSGATIMAKGAKAKLGSVVLNGGTAVLGNAETTLSATGTATATVYGQNLTFGTSQSTLKTGAKENLTVNSGKLVINGTDSAYKGTLLAKGGTLDLAARAVKNNVYLYNAALARANKLSGTLCVRHANARYSGSLTLTGDSKLNFTAGSKLTVTGTLTLKGDTALTLAGSGWKSGKYAIMSYGTLSATGSTSVFRLAQPLSGYSVYLSSENKNLVLTLTPTGRAAAAADTVTAAAAADLVPEPATAEPVLATTVTAPALTAETAAMADALVQADWAVVDAARAFTSGIRNRSTGTLTPDGKGAVWMNAIGSLARHSSVNGHSGSQVNLYGGAVGVEHNIAEHHSIGAAVGGTHANIGNTPMGKLRQDTTHVALYGNSRMGSKFSADWAAAFGSTNAHGNLGAARAKWQQNSTELSARLTYAEMLNDNTQLRTFAGLDYDATDADRTNGGKTGSVQALRGEFGMGLTHATETYSLYGEVGMVGDMVRHNPVAEADGFRLKGANPGRIGLKATLGGSIRINDTWSANASYNLETAADATMQSVNVGASRKF